VQIPFSAAEPRPAPSANAVRTLLGSEAVEWNIGHGLVEYPDAVARMDSRVAAIASGSAAEEVWLIEHPHLYTAGTSAAAGDLLVADRLPVFRSGRGGQYTYHGPGQRVAYVMLDLNRRKRDIRAYVGALEDWIIGTLAVFGIHGGRRDGRIGIWVARPDKGPGREDKIAAIGIRIRHWITFHGIALNVDPELDHFSGIVPCGVREQGVTSLADLGVEVTMAEVDRAMRRVFETVFGETIVVAAAEAPVSSPSP
jgi:lipoyl(octanoyl) transferase